MPSRFWKAGGDPFLLSRGFFAALLGGGGALGGTGTLSAPQLAFPTPQQAFTSPAAVSMVVALGADWITGNVFKLYKSTSSAMSSPTLVGSHTLTNTDITNGSFSIGVGTLSAITYFCALGNDGTNDSQYLSNVTGWGSVTAPTITTSAAPANVDELQTLWLPLTATGTGGVPALLISSSAPSGWSISGGADQLQFQEAVVSNVAGLEWLNNGFQSYNSPNNSTLNSANPYVVTVKATDLFGNFATETISQSVNQISQTPTNTTPWFTNVNPATLSQLYSSATVTWTGLTPGDNIPLQVSQSASGFQYNNNGAGWVNASGATIFVKNGWTFQLQGTAPSSLSSSITATVTIGSPTNTTQTWTLATAGSSATLVHTSGTRKSIYGNVATPFFQYIASGNGVGQCCPVGATSGAINSKFHLEAQAQYFGATGGASFFYCGFDDGSMVFNSPGYIADGSLPGYSGSGKNGFVLKGVKGVSNVHVFYNGNTAPGLTLTLPNALTDGDWFAFDVNTTTNAVLITYYHSGTATQLNGGTALVLTSQIPSSYNNFVGGGTGTGTAGTGVSDTITVNYGAASWLVTPQSGYLYYA